MVENTLINRIAQNLHNINQRHHIINMEPKSIPISRLVQVPTINTVPDSKITIKFSGNKLSKTTKRSHSLRILQPIHKVLSCINFDILEILDLFLFYDVPDCCVEHVQVAEDFAVAEHSCDCVVAHCHVGFVAS